MDKTSIYYKAEKKVKTKKRAMMSLIIWAAFAFFFIFMDMNDGSIFLEWAFYPIIGWGIGVLIQCVRAFDFFGMGEKWEKEELHKEMLKKQQVLKNFEEEYGDLDELDLDDLKEIRRETKDTDFV